jgi:hypothetical protein
MNVAQEIRQIANQLEIGRPDLATRLLHIASRVGRLELLLDDIAADAAQAERIRYESITHRPAAVIEFPRSRAGRAQGTPAGRP